MGFIVLTLSIYDKTISVYSIGKEDINKHDKGKPLFHTFFTIKDKKNSYRNNDYSIHIVFTFITIR